eukprot:Nk52_evm31s224 gene=Nk52_evmTU31s224
MEEIDKIVVKGGDEKGREPRKGELDADETLYGECQDEIEGKKASKGTEKDSGEDEEESVQRKKEGEVESEDSSGSSSEEEEEEDDEPKLKYQRLGGILTEVLQKNAATCLAVDDKFLALGTQWGSIYILDFDGNEIRHFNSHKARVNGISIDLNGDHFASCGEDGKVVICGLYSDDQNTSISSSKPVKGVALHPDYSKIQTRNFVTGDLDGNLKMNEKGWFGNSTEVLYKGDGPVYSVKWKGQFIAWATNNHVKVHDMNTGMLITQVNRAENSPDSSLYPPHLCWRGNNCLLIGWGNVVRVVVIKDRRNYEIQMGFTSGYGAKVAELAAMFETSYYVCGIAPYENDLAILAYIDPSTASESEDEGDDGEAHKSFASGEKKALRPELRIVTYDNDEISSDALTLINYENLRASDYQLDHLAIDGVYFVVSPHDIVMGKPRDIDDHISYLIMNEKFEEALLDAENHERELRTNSLVEIGQSYISYLIEREEFVAAAQICAKVLKNDSKLWENWIFTFAKINQLKAISELIPTENPRLSSTAYEMVLHYFLQNDYAGFQQTISDWPSELYNIKTVITAVLERLKIEPNALILMESLALLYANDEQFDKTLHIYLRLKRGDVFNLIKKYDLYDSIRDKVKLLLEFDVEEASKLLIENIERIPVSVVVSQLQKEHRSEKLLCYYLDKLFLEDPHAGSEYHEIQVGLYAEYDPAKLINFLRQSNYYPLEKAIAVCEQRELIPEMVFLLGRVGRYRQALMLIIEKLRDVKQAIEFAKDQDDVELWDDLISYSMDKPEFIHGLLNSVGTHIDPILLIKRIPMNMEIPDLKNSLVRILQDFQLQISLREGCQQILVSDSVDLMRRHNRALARGAYHSEEAQCEVCKRSMAQALEVSLKPSTEKVKPERFIMFYCKHVYHDTCLGSQHSATSSIPASGGENSRNENHEEALFCPICRNETMRKEKADKRSHRK